MEGKNKIRTDENKNINERKQSQTKIIMNERKERRTSDENININEGQTIIRHT